MEGIFFLFSPPPLVPCLFFMAFMLAFSSVLHTLHTGLSTSFLHHKFDIPSCLESVNLVLQHIVLLITSPKLVPGVVASVFYIGTVFSTCLVRSDTPNDGVAITS